MNLRHRAAKVEIRLDQPYAAVFYIFELAHITTVS